MIFRAIAPVDWCGVIEFEMSRFSLVFLEQLLRYRGVEIHNIIKYLKKLDEQSACNITVTEPVTTDFVCGFITRESVGSILRQRRGHKLKEWQIVCDALEESLLRARCIRRAEYEFGQNP
jgi:hypothetical protein